MEHHQMDFLFDEDDKLTHTEVGTVFSKEQWYIFRITWPMQLFWLVLYAAIAFTGYAIVWHAAHAAEYANSPNRDWYRAQEINPEARARLKVAWKSCCDNSDVVQTRFRVDRTTAADEWWWLDGNQWRKVPEDIIHWQEPTPDGQPLLFVYSGIPTCFYPGEGGI